MAGKKKLSKKEKARLEAEQAELLRIEMEKERQRKLEEERRRRQIEYEQAKERQKQEIQENKKRRAQLKNSMEFFGEVKSITDAIKASEKEESDWEKYMRCNGLPNANSPSDLRKYMHQWRADIERRNRESRNWLLRTDERTLLTQDLNAPNLSRNYLRQQQGQLGDVYAQRIREVLGILLELEETIVDSKKPAHIIADLKQLKMEIRVFLSDHIDEFTYKTMSHIERDMEIDRPGVSKHLYESDVFKSHFWTFSKDAQISLNPKPRIGEQIQPSEIDFPQMALQIALPPSVNLQSSAMRGLWLNYDHFSDYCNSYSVKKSPPEHINILRYTKKEWHKRKEILQNMLDDCIKETPQTAVTLDQDSSNTSKPVPERNFDVDKLYAEYEEELNKARKRVIGPEAYGLLETDVNLRKYRIIGGVYRIDYLEVPLQDKRLNTRSFIRTIVSPNRLTHKNFYQTYKPPPPAQPGVRRLPEEIEAEMRMVEAALDKLALVTLDLPDSVIWFEPPIACRWETELETLESNIIEGVKPPVTATPTDVTPLSTTTNTSPLKGSPRFPARMRKRSSQKSAASAVSVREIEDFDMFNIPRGIDIYSLLRDFVVPRLPPGFCVRWEKSIVTLSAKAAARKRRKLRKKQLKQGKQKILFLAKHKSELPGAWSEEKKSEEHEQQVHLREEYIDEDFLDWKEPRELFPSIHLDKMIKFKKAEREIKSNDEGEGAECEEKKNGKKVLEIQMSNGFGNGNGKGMANGHIGKNGIGNGNGAGNGNEYKSGSSGKTSVASSRYASIEKEKKEEKVEGKKEVVKKSYMFSKLLEDLDHLCELQMPLQMEALRRISANLTSPAATIGSQDAATETKEPNQQPAETPQPAFAYYSGISFLRDMEAKTDRDDNREAEEAAQETEDESSTDEYDEADEADYFFGAEEVTEVDEEKGDEEEEAQAELPQLTGVRAQHATVLANLNTLVSAKDGADSVPASGAAAATVSASDGLRQLLSKHKQSESDSSDGKCHREDNMLALTQGKWSTRDVHDTKFNEDKLSIQFRTGRLGIFGFALNRYSNMPYQTWEIKPDFKSPGTVLFSFTASIISLDMNISSAGYCVNNFQGGSTTAISEMLGKTLSLSELKDILIAAAVDIFPEVDTFCYTEGTCEKNYVMELHLYACMATLALSHNFSWSRWNLLAGSRTIVLLMRELIEGKKVPYHSTLLVTPLKTAIIDCTEVSASFNSAGIPGMQYYADLYQLSQAYALPSSLEKQRNMDPMLRDNISSILSAIRPLSFC